MYPVGSCYFSTVNTSPATVVGGTWAAMTGGMLGLAGSTGIASAASNGGSRKISSNQMPSHNHAAANAENDEATYHFNVSLPFSTTAIGRASVQRGSSGATYFAILDNRAADDAIGDGTQDLGASATTKNTGGAQIIFLRTPLFTVGGELPKRVGDR